MYLSADGPTRSVRTVPTDGGELLLTGGNGHVVGRHAHTQQLVDDLTKWTERTFPGAERTHWWSAQDYHPVDELPYVGTLGPRNDRILIATGYDKWGMTNSVAAAFALSSRVLGGSTPWARALDSWSRHEVAGFGSAVAFNAGVAFNMANGWLRPLAGAAAGHKGDPAEGDGRVEWQGRKPVAVCTVDGQTQRRSAICPHLHGIVSWNDAERSWDCPLHGSRFAADGSVLEGPATRGLAPG
jgi:nitrite reductase/ring-hydroxylating ferredoxin subunit